MVWASVAEGCWEEAASWRGGGDARANLRRRAFEDDHVEFRVPRIEREIAAEEIGGEEPWTRVASRGVFEAIRRRRGSRAGGMRGARSTTTRTPTRRRTSNTQNRIIGIIAHATTMTMTR